MSDMRTIAMLLATKDYTGSASIDADIWSESLTADEREDYEVTATAILSKLDGGSR